jgi:hypothetical protein
MAEVHKAFTEFTEVKTVNDLYNIGKTVDEIVHMLNLDIPL